MAILVTNGSWQWRGIGKGGSGPHPRPRPACSCWSGPPEPSRVPRVLHRRLGARTAAQENADPPVTSAAQNRDRTWRVCHSAPWSFRPGILILRQNDRGCKARPPERAGGPLVCPLCTSVGPQFSSDRAFIPRISILHMLHLSRARALGCPAPALALECGGPASPPNLAPRSPRCL